VLLIGFCGLADSCGGAFAIAVVSIRWGPGNAMLQPWIQFARRRPSPLIWVIGVDWLSLILHSFQLSARLRSLASAVRFALVVFDCFCIPARGRMETPILRSLGL